jgi:hypothetical protein
MQGQAKYTGGAQDKVGTAFQIANVTLIIAPEQRLRSSMFPDFSA